MVTPKVKPEDRKRAPAKPSMLRRKPAFKRSDNFLKLAKDALARHEPDTISDAQLQKVFAVAVKLYAAKVERRGEDVKPFRDGTVTTTESIVAACALIRAADLNLFDVAMWFNRASPMT